MTSQHESEAQETMKEVGGTMKQPYTTPQLTVHGNVEQITQGNDPMGVKDAKGMGNTNSGKPSKPPK